MKYVINGCFGEPCVVPESAQKDQGGFIRAMRQRRNYIHAGLPTPAAEISAPLLRDKMENPYAFRMTMEFLKSEHAANLAAINNGMMRLDKDNFRDFTLDPDDYTSMDLPEV